MALTSRVLVMTSSIGSPTSRIASCAHRRERLPRGEALTEHLGSLRVVHHGVDRGADEREAGWRRAGHPLREPLHDPPHVLQVVPPGDLHDEWAVRRERAGTTEDGGGGSRPGAAASEEARAGQQLQNAGRGSGAVQGAVGSMEGTTIQTSLPASWAARTPGARTRTCGTCPGAAGGRPRPPR